MTLFPEWLFTLIVYAGIGLAALGAILLLALLSVDWKGKTLW